MSSTFYLYSPAVSRERRNSITHTSPSPKPVVETIQMPDPSYQEFLKSLTAFSAGNMKEAAARLRSGTQFLKKELGETKGMTRQLVDKVTKKLETLEAQVEQGKIKDENIISAALADAEAVAAHNYILGS